MITRVFTALLREYLDLFPVVALIGSRQVGKSTLVQDPAIGANRRYVTLDDLSTRSLATADPDGLLDWSERITIDEVQLAPELLRGIKRRVDTDRTPGRFLLTGSADLNTCADLSHVLAGRVGVLRLPPITCFESDGAQGEPLWSAFAREGSKACARALPASPVYDWDRLLIGGFPLSLLAPSWRARTLWFESFRNTYLERDLRRICDVGNLMGFARLMELSATRTGQVLNQANLGRDAGINAATTGRYLSVLEASFLIHRLPPYFENLGKRLVKSPKLYWEDTGLAGHLLGLDPDAIPRTHPALGPLFETAVIQEVRSLLPVFAPRARLYYVRSHDGLETDGLLQLGSRRVAFEVKASTTVKADDARGLTRWMSLSGRDEEGMVLYAGETIKPLTAKIWAVPLRARVSCWGEMHGAGSTEDGARVLCPEGA